MEIQSSLKWIGVMVAAGVITGVTLQFVTGYLAAQAQLAAMAELQRAFTLMLEQNSKPATTPRKQLNPLFSNKCTL